MNELIKNLIFSALRKVIFGAGAVYVAWLVEKGIATEGDIVRMIEIVVAAAMVLVPALWSFVRALIAKRKA